MKSIIGRGIHDFWMGIILFLGMIISINFPTNAGDSSWTYSELIPDLYHAGAGTTLDPYVITNWNHLNNVRQNLSAHFKLAFNLDQNTEGYTGIGDSWTPIGDNNSQFTGSFDGAGHVISNLTISSQTNDNVGLFGFTKGTSSSDRVTISNLGLVGATVTGRNQVGALVGQALNTTINNASASGSVKGGASVGGLIGIARTVNISESYAIVDVTGTGINVGGLVGRSYDKGMITRSYATGNVKGGDRVGGLVGDQQETPIDDSYAIGNVHGKDRVGGLVGNSHFSNVTNSYATGVATGTTVNVGGLVGIWSSGSPNKITDSYWNSNALHSATNGLGTGKTLAEMYDSATYTGWNTSIWSFFEGRGATVEGYEVAQGLPYLTNVTREQDRVGDISTLFDGGWGGQTDGNQTGADGSAYTITNASQLQNINQVVNDGFAFELLNNIDLQDINWTPIGRISFLEPMDFKGSFDGRGHTVDNLTITNAATPRQGLFGSAIGATIKNIGVTNVNITSNQFAVGGLVGFISAGTIENAYVTGSVRGSYSVGGLVGSTSSSSTVSQSYSTAKVDGTSDDSSGIGGLVGSLSGSISSSFATGNVDGNGPSVGGLVGSLSSGSISASYATGDVNGASRVGGLVGYSLGSISNSYATGDVDGSREVGGLVGESGDSTSITNSYAIGAATSEVPFGGTGGLVGVRHITATITNSYWNSDAAHLEAGTPVISSVGVGKTLAELYNSDTFAAWKTQDTPWSFGGGRGAAAEGYEVSEVLPYLTNVTRAEDIVTGNTYTLFAGGWGGQTDGDQTGADGSAYTITNATQLQNINLVANSGFDFELSNNINLSGVTWTPIGSSFDKKFSGVFDGDGHTISNLEIDSTGVGIGLFGWTDDATIKNVGLIDVSVKGEEFVGGLVGVLDNSRVYQSYSVGGNVTASNQAVGGLVGQAVSSEIEQSYSTSNVGNETNKGERSGGLVGVLGNDSSVKQSYASGNVFGSISVGGLVGLAVGTIEQSYANGAVEGNERVGSLVGLLDTGHSIIESYATGKVLGNDDVGGLVGLNEGIVTTSYFDKTINPGMADEAEYGKTTAELQSLATFEAQWDIVADPNVLKGYPRLTHFVDGIDSHVWVIGTKEITLTGTYQGFSGIDNTITLILSEAIDATEVYIGSTEITGFTQDGASITITVPQGKAVGEHDIRIVTALGDLIYLAAYTSSDNAGLLFEGGDGTSGNPYQIKDWTQLQNINLVANQGHHFFLNNDLNEQSKDYNIQVKDGEVLANGGKGWRPIGRYVDDPDMSVALNLAFSGTLDGNEKTISGLRFNHGKGQNIGLFAAIHEATVKNLTINDAELQTQSSEINEEQDRNVALLAANVGDFELDNVSVTGKISVNASHDKELRYVGGVFARGRVSGTEEKPQVIKDSDFNIVFDIVITDDALPSLRDFGAISARAPVRFWNISNTSISGAITAKTEEGASFRADSFRDVGLMVGTAGNDWTLTNVTVDGNISVSNFGRLDEVALFSGKAGSLWQLNDVTVNGYIHLHDIGSLNEISILAGDPANEWQIDNLKIDGEIKAEASGGLQRVALVAGNPSLRWEIENSSVKGNIELQTSATSAEAIRNISFIAGDPSSQWKISNTLIEGDIKLIATQGGMTAIGLVAGNSTSRWEIDGLTVKGNLDLEAKENIFRTSLFAGNPSGDWIIRKSSLEGNAKMKSTDGEVYFVGLLASHPLSIWEIENLNIRGDLDISAHGDVYDVGLLAGNARGDWNVKELSTKGNISIQNGGDVYSIGGLIGFRNSAQTDMPSTFEKVYTSGKLNVNSGGHVRNIGGLFGLIEQEDRINDLHPTTLRNAYSTMDVKIEASQSVDGTGGLIGRISEPEFVMFGTQKLTLLNTYYAGEMILPDGATGSGGVVGIVAQNVTAEINQSFWDAEKSLGDPGDSNYDALGKTTAEMKSLATFTSELDPDGWDFENVWAINPTGWISYPYLKALDYDSPGETPENNPIPGLERRLENTIEFDQLQDVVYGIVPFDPGATATSADQVTYTSSNPDVADIENNLIVIKGVGETTITATLVNTFGYFDAIPVSQELKVLPKSISVEGIVVENKFYDGTAIASILGTANLEGVVGQDDVALSGEPVFTFEQANAGENINVLVTGWTLTGKSAINYTLKLPSLTGTIDKASLTITADDKQKTYGEENPALTFSYTGLVNGDTQVSSEPSISTTATAASNVGTYPITLSGGSDDNYEIELKAGTLTVGKKSLTITADDKQKTYGEENPALTFSYTGLVNGDTQVSSEPSINTSATASSNVGTYPITLSGGSDDNYEIELKAGTLTVGKKSLMITADDKQKTYGEENPALTFSYTGLVNSDTKIATEPSISTMTTASSAVGTYPITLTGGSDANYDITLVAGELEVTKASVTITADNKDKVYGSVNPPLT
ncbi:MBG domain-containing protein, partial [Belliella buryatensis]